MQSLLPIAEKIGALLKDRRETIAIAESTTGGLVSAALLSDRWSVGLLSRRRRRLHAQGSPRPARYS